MRRPFRLSLLLCLQLVAGCASTSVITTMLPPQRLERPICTTAVIIHDQPGDVPRGGRVVAQLRLEGGGLGLTNEKIRRRLQEAAARVGANRVFATEVTTPSTLAALGMTLATSWNAREREMLQTEAMTNQNGSTEASVPPPTDPNFYGKGLAYAIFVPDDTLRTNMECPR